MASLAHLRVHNRHPPCRWEGQRRSRHPLPFGRILLHDTTATPGLCSTGHRPGGRRGSTTPARDHLRTSTPAYASRRHYHWCDVSTGRPRPLVPEQWRRTAFSTLHNLAHPSVRATRKLVAQRFVWPGMNKDLSTWSRACRRCQLVKVHQHTVAPLVTFQPPTQHFQHVHIDIVGPLPVSRDHIYLFTIIDRYTRWPEAIPMRDMTTASCVQAFLHAMFPVSCARVRAHTRKTGAHSCKMSAQTKGKRQRTKVLFGVAY